MIASSPLLADLLQFLHSHSDLVSRKASTVLTPKYLGT